MILAFGDRATTPAASWRRGRRALRRKEAGARGAVVAVAEAHRDESALRRAAPPPRAPP
jgi:hypothetical protein